jgi:hypothetical protein
MKVMSDPIRFETAPLLLGSERDRMKADSCVYRVFRDRSLSSGDFRCALAKLQRSETARNS